MRLKHAAYVYNPFQICLKINNCHSSAERYSSCSLTRQGNVTKCLCHYVFKITGDNY
jgi:hypothetical protein